MLSTVWIARAALGTAVLSLALNAYLLAQVRHPERLAAPAVMRMFERLAAEDARVRYQVKVPAGTPLRFDIPLDERLNVKLNTQLPIDTRVQVPVRSPVGSYTLNIPIKTTIPIRTEVPLHIRHTLQLRTNTQMELVAPLEIRIRDLPLDALRRSLEP
ncbi:hypothetical protein BH24GEM2_BH24GEM2_02060 [soil metagenome]